MVSMGAKFVDSVARHGQNLQIFEHCLPSCCVFIMFKKIQNPAACEMRPVIRFLNAKNMTPAEIHCQLCDVYGEHAVISSMTRRCVRLFNAGRENVRDDPRSGRPSVVNADLVRAVEENIRENK